MNLLPAIALISVHRDPASETGSQNVYVRQLGEALSRLGWRVDMFTRKTSVTQSDIVQHNANCRTVRLNLGVFGFVPRQELIGYLPEFVKQLRRFQSANKIKYSLIHTNYWLSAWVGMELKKIQPLKHIHTYHSVGAVKYARTDRPTNIARTRIAIEKRCLETADLTIATCPQQKRYLEKLVSKRGNIEIIPCGANIDTFGFITRTIAKQQIGIESDVFNILYVGRFDHTQGLETLIKAVSKPYLHSAGNIKLTLVSNSQLHIEDKSSQKRIEDLVWNLGLDNVTTFVRSLTRDELAVYYAAADVCVVPSYYSSSGIVAIEAMASGTPVVASNVGGLKYAVEHEQTGLLIPASNTTLLTKAIYRLLSQPEWRRELGVNAKQRVEYLFTWDTIAEQLSELYAELLNSHRLEALERSFQPSVQAISA